MGQNEGATHMDPMKDSAITTRLQKAADEAAEALRAPEGSKLLSEAVNAAEERSNNFNRKLQLDSSFLRDKITL